jgi:hypothetical protein
MKTPISKTDLAALQRMLARVKAKQEAYFQRHHRLLTPYDGQFWAVTQAIYDLETGRLCES